MRDAPAASCAKEKHTSKSPQVRRSNPALPARVVLTASFVISSVNGLCCHRRRPRCKSIVGQLDASVAASGPHDFAVCRWCFVRRKVLAPDTTCIHRIPRPTFVTIAKRPSWRARDAGRGASDLPDVTSENDCDKRHDGQIGAREQAAVKRDPASRTRCGVCTTATDQQSTTLHSLGALRSIREGFRRSPDQPPKHAREAKKKSFIPSAAPAAVRCPGTPAWLRSARHDRRAPDGLHH